MRKLHRTLALFFSPFLLTSAVTGLLWAYAPYLYLKQEAPKPKPLITAVEEARVHLSPVQAIHAAQKSGDIGKVMSVVLRVDEGDVIYAVMSGSKKDQKETVVNAETGEISHKPKKKVSDLHRWVMKIHRLEFFGTKKELVMIPGAGLLLMLCTGSFLWKRKK